jgi:hypothetical protein
MQAHDALVFESEAAARTEAAWSYEWLARDRDQERCRAVKVKRCAMSLTYADRAVSIHAVPAFLH